MVAQTSSVAMHRLVALVVKLQAAMQGWMTEAAAELPVCGTREARLVDYSEFEVRRNFLEEKAPAGHSHQPRESMAGLDTAN